MRYKLGPKIRETNTTESVFLINDDGSGFCIPFAPDNTDYQKYLEWVAKGNTPEPTDE